MNDAVKAIIERVLDDFHQPDSLDRIAAHIIPRDDRPCGTWSLLNRWIVQGNDTDDARSYEQWQKVKRWVKRGSKAMHILAPMKIWKKRTNAKTGKEETYSILIGFRRLAKFRYQDTDGEPMKYPDFTPRALPPLLNVAKTWGLDVKYSPDIFGDHLAGSFGIESGEIKLASHDPKVFFHELAHAAHQKIQGAKLKAGSDPQQEIIAEFSAAILLRLYGCKGEGNAYDYIARYAGHTEKNDVLKACTGVLSTVDKVVREILTVEMGEDTDESDS
jgi:hypothetical protein